jgi:hypothetical protein
MSKMIFCFLIKSALRQVLRFQPASAEGDEEEASTSLTEVAEEDRVWNNKMCGFTNVLVCLALMRPRQG